MLCDISENNRKERRGNDFKIGRVAANSFSLGHQHTLWSPHIWRQLRKARAGLHSVRTKELLANENYQVWFLSWTQAFQLEEHRPVGWVESLRLPIHVIRDPDGTKKVIIWKSTQRNSDRKFPFPNLAKDINLQIQEAKQTPNRTNLKFMSWYIIIKPLITKDKFLKILKAARKK